MIKRLSYLQIYDEKMNIIVKFFYWKIKHVYKFQSLCLQLMLQQKHMVNLSRKY